MILTIHILGHDGSLVLASLTSRSRGTAESVAGLRYRLRAAARYLQR
jgi:hypothetical protein